jgi:hypothetical protein
MKILFSNIMPIEITFVSKYMYTCSRVSMVGKVGAPQGMEGRLGEQQCLVGRDSRCSLVNGGKFQGAMVFPYGESGHFPRSGGKF